MISAGEVHLPGRPKDIVGLKALAIVAVRAFANVRPAGVKVHAGAPILELGLEEARLRRAGRGGRQPDRRGRPGLGEDGRPGGADARLGAAARHGVDVPHRRPVDRRVERDPRGRRARGAARHRRPHQRRHDRPPRRRHRAAGRERDGDRDRPLRQRPGGAPRDRARARDRRAGSRDPRQRRAVGDRRRAARDPAHDGPPGLARRHRARDGRLPRHRQHRAGPPARDRDDRRRPRGGHRPRRRPAGLRRGLRARRPRDRRPAGRRDDPHRRQAGRRPQPQHAARRRARPRSSRARASPAAGTSQVRWRRCTSACGCRASRSATRRRRSPRWAPTCGAPRTSASRRAMLIDHLLVAPPAYRTTWLEPITLLAALSGVTRTIQLGTLVLVLPFREPVAVRQAVGDARPAVRRAVDPRRRRGLDGGRVRGRRHPAPRARRADERAARADHRAVDAGAT